MELGRLSPVFPALHHAVSDCHGPTHGSGIEQVLRVGRGLHLAHLVHMAEAKLMAQLRNARFVTWPNWQSQP
eukprot:5237425-Amphidinium_carterae.1